MRALALLLILLAAGAAAAHEADPGAASITPENLMADVRVLTAPELGGRLPGTAGYDEAMRYCSDRFAALGLEAGGDDGWSQRLTMELNQIRSCELTLVGADGVAEPLALGSDFACRGFTGKGVADAPVVFVGYGLSLPERGHDDYAGLDVRGKIVLAIKPAPKWEPADGEGWGDVHLPRPVDAVADRVHVVGWHVQQVRAEELPFRGDGQRAVAPGRRVEVVRLGGGDGEGRERDGRQQRVAKTHRGTPFSGCVPSAGTGRAKRVVGDRAPSSVPPRTRDGIELFRPPPFIDIGCSTGG
jgi:hypothetical protein